MEQISDHDQGVANSNQSALNNQQKNTKAVFQLLEVKNNTQQKSKTQKGGKADADSKDEGKSSVQKLQDARAHNANVEKMDQDAINQMIQEKINAIDGQPQDKGQSNADDSSAAQLEKAKTAKCDAMLAKLTKIYKNGEEDNQNKIVQMVDLFNEEVIEFYKNSFMDIVQTSKEQVTNQYLSEFHNERSGNADVILQKYNMLCKEYQNQSKEFKTKHDEISVSEKSKRGEIIKNFEDHYANIKKQMDEEQAQLVDAETGEYLIEKESQKLEENYNDLIAQIQEKGDLMTKSLEEKETGKSSLQEQMSTTLTSQEEQLQKEIAEYRGAADKKKQEEQELENVLKQYKERYQEFDKGLKQSRRTIGQQEKEINYMNRTIKTLEETKKKTLLASSTEFAELQQNANQGGGGGGKKNKKKKNKGTSALDKEAEADLLKKLEEDNKNMEESIDKIKQDWETEKAKIMADKEAIQFKCSQIQQLIKLKKEEQN